MLTSWSWRTEQLQVGRLFLQWCHHLMDGAYHVSLSHVSAANILFMKPCSVVVEYYPYGKQKAAAANTCRCMLSHIVNCFEKASIPYLILMWLMSQCFFLPLCYICPIVRCLWWVLRASLARNGYFALRAPRHHSARLVQCEMFDWIRKCWLPVQPLYIARHLQVARDRGLCSAAVSYSSSDHGGHPVATTYSGTGDSWQTPLHRHTPSL